MSSADRQRQPLHPGHELILREPSRTGLFLDFDGTLAPFVGSSEEVEIPSDLSGVLSDLSQVLGVVAVVSGRPLPFLNKTFPDHAVHLAGVYGLEERRDGTPADAIGVAPWLPVLADACRELAAMIAGHPGWTVKDKRVSVVVHWQPELVAAETALRLDGEMRRLAHRSGLRLQTGKCAYELVPPVPVDKGAVVRGMIAGAELDTVVCIGDDVGDVVAFEAAHQVGGLAIAVDDGRNGVHATPAAVLDAADAVLDGPADVLSWLLDLRRDAAGHAGRP
jgi:trehalose 6-phosphate phosphatase